LSPFSDPVAGRWVIDVHFEGRIYRPPSEATSFILQATIGCSWNACTYCDMYREKKFRVRPLAETLAMLDEASAHPDARFVEKVFVADGDALVMPSDHWMQILKKCGAAFPNLRRVSAYAMARNVLDKDAAELAALQKAGLHLLYMGPESGDDVTLRKIAKGDDAAAHVEAATRAHAAGMKLSVITLLGAGGKARTQEHASATASLITGMDPAFFSALTLTVIPQTPQEKLVRLGKFALPSVEEMLQELRILVSESRPTHAVFRTNHASNYLPLGGRLPQDRDAILKLIDSALKGDIPLKPEWARAL
jgi:radical SAM superfamily enzyme YgiQ (UPF0313 family)